MDMNISEVVETIEKIHPYIDDRTMKTKITNLLNMLFFFYDKRKFSMFNVYNYIQILLRY